MKKTVTMAFAALGLLVACGDQEGRGGLTAEEERQLDNAAAMLEDNLIDVSPDSLVMNEAELQAMDAEAAANAEAGEAANAETGEAAQP